MPNRIITTIAAAGLITLGALTAAGPSHAQTPEPSPTSIALETETASVSEAAQQTATPATTQPTPRSLSPREQELLDSIMTPEEQAQLAKKNQEAGNAVLAAVMGASLALLAGGVMISRAIRGRKKREEIPA